MTTKVDKTTLEYLDDWAHNFSFIEGNYCNGWDVIGRDGGAMQCEQCLDLQMFYETFVKFKENTISKTKLWEEAISLDSLTPDNFECVTLFKIAEEATLEEVIEYQNKINERLHTDNDPSPCACEMDIGGCDCDDSCECFENHEEDEL